MPQNLSVAKRGRVRRKEPNLRRRIGKLSTCILIHVTLIIDISFNNFERRSQKNSDV